jgi:hypothetical protein
MIKASRVGPIALLVVALFSGSASASAIEFRAIVSALPENPPESVAPVDLLQGGTYSAGSPSLSPLTQYEALFYTHNSISINQTANVEFGVYVPSGGSAIADSVAEILVQVPIHGTIFGDGLTSDLQGGFGGTGSTATILPFPVGLPPELVDLIQHPERVHISAYVSGGSANNLVTTLSIDGFGAAMPVPEPTTLCVFAISLVGGALSRRLHSTRR